MASCVPEKSCKLYKVKWGKAYEWGYVRLGTGASTFNGVAVDAHISAQVLLSVSMTFAQSHSDTVC